MPNFLKTSTQGAAPVALSDVTKNYRKCTIIACKALTGPTAAPNTGVVYLGRSATANQQPLEMQPGDERSFDAAPGGMGDLAGLFLKVATTGDGVVVEYT